MLWFYDRDEETLRLETVYDNATSEFVVIVHYPGGQKRRQPFTDRTEFQRWLEAFERNLAIQHWTGRGGPIILPYGWPDKQAN